MTPTVDSTIAIDEGTTEAAKETTDTLSLDNEILETHMVATSTCRVTGPAGAGINRDSVEGDRPQEMPTLVPGRGIRPFAIPASDHGRHALNIGVTSNRADRTKAAAPVPCQEALAHRSPKEEGLPTHGVQGHHVADENLHRPIRVAARSRAALRLQRVESCAGAEASAEEMKVTQTGDTTGVAGEPAMQRNGRQADDATAPPHHHIREDMDTFADV